MAGLDSDTIINGTNFRWRIRIVQPNLTQDTFGGWRLDDATPIPGGDVWASIEALSATAFGKTVYAAQQETSQVTHLIKIRYFDGVKASMGIWFRNRQFLIQAAVDPDEQQKVLLLLCLERNDSANEVPA